MAPAFDACQFSNVGAKKALSSALLPQDRTISTFEGIARGDVDDMDRVDADAGVAEEERSVVHRPGLPGKGVNIGAKGITILEVYNGNIDVNVISGEDVSIGASTVLSTREVEKGKAEGEAGISVCMTIGVLNARKATVMFFANFMAEVGVSNGDQSALYRNEDVESSPEVPVPESVSLASYQV